MSHDQNFKNLILDYPRASLEFFAEEETGNLSSQTHIVPIRQEQLKERLGERFRELDTPLLVEWPDGSREAVVFILEEETDPRRFSIHRLAHYCLDISELLGIIRVVPVVIFLHPGDYARELRLAGERNTYLSFRFMVCDLGNLFAERYLKSSNIVIRLNLPNMRYEPDQKLDIYTRAQEGLMELEKNPEKRLKYIEFIDQYADLSEEEQTEYQEKYLRNSHKKEEIMGICQKFREEGVQQGVRQGMLQGESTLLSRQIQSRFGPLPDWVKERIEKADRETLEEWGVRILESKSIEEIFLPH